jgi:serine phosphatase RsbU (regulator of sigma subunit)
MALGKSLCKSCALRGETDIGAIIQRADAEISRDNPEMLFITLFAGILDLRTGELLFCNAGHDPPFYLRAGEAPRLMESVGGPPLCVAEDFPYSTESRQLRAGDLLCITTDGVTEAMNAEGAWIGRERVLGVLASMAPETGAKALTKGLQDAVQAYVAGADPSDDLTILTIRWLGPAAQDLSERSSPPAGS